MKDNPHVQIVALKSGTRQWIRVTGKAYETKDIASKWDMLDACPILQKRFVANSDNYALFRLTEMTAERMSDSGASTIS